MIIKTKKDIQRLITFMKKSNNVLKYEKEGTEILIKYNKHDNNFDIATKDNQLISNGFVLESTLVYQLWIDRKYANISLIHWTL